MSKIQIRKKHILLQLGLFNNFNHDLGELKQLIEKNGNRNLFKEFYDLQITEKFQRPIEYFSRLIFKVVVSLERIEYFTKGNVRGRDSSLRVLGQGVVKNAIWDEIVRLNCRMVNSYHKVRDWLLTQDVLILFGCQLRGENEQNCCVKLPSPVLNDDIQIETVFEEMHRMYLVLFGAPDRVPDVQEPK